MTTRTKNIMLLTCAGWLTVGVCKPFLSDAQQRPVQVNSKLALDAAVRTGKLPNGFTYYIRRNTEPRNRVVFYLANKVGSILETDAQQGLAHFMEHMSFNGTKHFPKSQLVDYLQRSGVRFGADLNAYTSFDETVYQLPLPADNPEILRNGLQIMRDWAQEATLDAAEIDKERGVVLEEKRLGKGAQERMRTKFFPTLLNQSRYALRLPIGTEEVLSGFKPETIRAYYHDWYRPDLQALIVVGDMDVAQMEKTIRAKFSDLKNPASAKKRPDYTVPLTGKNQFLQVTDPEMTATVAQVIIKHKQPKLATAADYRGAITRSLFNQMLEERYAALSRSANPPFVQGGAAIEELMGGLDNFGAFIVAKPGQLETGFKAVWREVLRAEQFGFLPGELTRAKAAYLNQTLSSLREKDKTPSENYVKEYLQYFLKGTAAPGIEKETELTRKYLSSITLQDLRLLTAAYIRGSNRDILLLAPDKDKEQLPDKVLVSKWMKELAAEKLEAYQDQVSTQPLLSAEPRSGTIVRSENLAGKITRLTLSNGVKVILKPTTFKNNEILFSAFSPGGTSLYPDTDFQSAANSADVVAAFGAGNYDLTQLGKWLSGKQVAVRPFIRERSQGISGVTEPKDLETALQLTYASLVQPRKDSSVFEGIIQQSKASLANRMNDPASVYKDTVSALLGNYNIRRTGPTVAKMDQVSLDKAFSIFNERFSDASQMTFVFTGSFDVAAIKPLIEKYIASLPSLNKNEQAKDLGIHAPSGRIEKKVYKGTEPKATVQLFFTGDFAYTPEENIRLDALKEVLEIRLLERLREEESGVYTPGAFAITSKFPRPRYLFGINFGCAPQNADKLTASALDEVKRLQEQGPAQVNIDKFKAEQLRARESELRTNPFWLAYLQQQLENGEPLDALDHYNNELHKLTPEILQQTAQRYFNGKNLIRAVLLPETK
jgi:zinc protease